MDNKNNLLKSRFITLGCALILSSLAIKAKAHDHPINVSVPSAEYGQEVFQQRCVLCHGTKGEGDGRMARVIKNPPPIDLTASRLPDDYLKEIIVKGSEAMGRSKHMPPWGEALHDVEIDSIVLYVKSIRD